MADNVSINTGSGATIAADEVADSTLGTVQVQYVKLMDGTNDGTTRGVIGANGLTVDVSASSGVGSLTETAPATDTASSGLNGRLQRIAQRITALIAQLPASLGMKTAANSLSVTVASDDALLSAVATIRDATSTVNVGLDTSAIYNGSTALTPKFAKIAASSSGDNTLVAAVTSKKIRVLAYNFSCAGTVNAKFQSGAAGTDLTGLKYGVANSGIVAPFNPAGWFETAAGTLLNLNLSAATAVGGELVYIEV